jgi:hypothetical protein
VALASLGSATTTGLSATTAAGVEAATDDVDAERRLVEPSDGPAEVEENAERRTFLAALEAADTHPPPLGLLATTPFHGPSPLHAL